MFAEFTEHLLNSEKTFVDILEDVCWHPRTHLSTSRQISVDIWHDSLSTSLKFRCLWCFWLIHNRFTVSIQSESSRCIHLLSLLHVSIAFACLHVMYSKNVLQREDSVTVFAQVQFCPFSSGACCFFMRLRAAYQRGVFENSVSDNWKEGETPDDGREYTAREKGEPRRRKRRSAFEVTSLQVCRPLRSPPTDRRTFKIQQKIHRLSFTPGQLHINT